MSVQGEPPANMRTAWRLLLRKSLPPTLLSHMHYAVFGLGDSGLFVHTLYLGMYSVCVCMWDMNQARHSSNRGQQHVGGTLG